MDIEPGSVYRIRPCTFKPGMEGKFVVHVFSEHQVHLGEEKSDRLIVKVSFWLITWLVVTPCSHRESGIRVEAAEISTRGETILSID